MRSVVIVSLLCAWGTSQASPRASFELDVGATRLYEQFGLEVSGDGGARLNQSLVVGLRAFAFRVPDVETQRGTDYVSNGPVSGVGVGPAIHFDLPHAPLWLGGSVAAVRITGFHEADPALAIEARLGATLLRDAGDALVVFLNGRGYAASERPTWQAGVAIGYLVD